MRLSIALVLAAIAAAPAASAQQEAATATNEFARDLHRKLVENPGNILWSPYSIEVALAMCAEGAGGETAREMAAVLHLPEKSGLAFQELTKALVPKPRRNRGDESEPVWRFETANAIWPSDRAEILASYKERVRNAFGADANTLDYSKTDAAVEAINSWTAERTRGRIKTLVTADVVPPETRLVLTNAVWFKARWANTFVEGLTEPKPFHRLDGGSLDVPTMRRNARFAYGETDAAHVLEMPYEGGETSMVVVLPKANDGIGAIEKEAPASYLAALGKPRLIALSFPKFTFSTGYELRRPLVELGMKLAMDSKDADFKGISPKEPIFIGAVIHKAFIAVDEEGTEAAAATAVGMRAGSAPKPEEPLPIVADHPFLFFIRHKKTDTLLFAGRLADPSTR